MQGLSTVVKKKKSEDCWLITSHVMFKNSTMARVNFNFKARLPCTIMHPKNKYLKKQKEIPTDEEVELHVYLPVDPTTNNQLYNDIFEKLKKLKFKMKSE